jgi:hypothetical protein
MKRSITNAEKMMMMMEHAHQNEDEALLSL